MRLPKADRDTLRGILEDIERAEALLDECGQVAARGIERLDCFAVKSAINQPTKGHTSCQE